MFRRWRKAPAPEEHAPDLSSFELALEAAKLAQKEIEKAVAAVDAAVAAGNVEEAAKAAASCAHAAAQVIMPFLLRDLQLNLTIV